MLHKTKGIILKSFSYDEADTIVRVFTKNNGKMDMLAKGAKKLKSKLASSVQPFTLGEYTYYQKNNNLAVLKQSDILKHYKIIVSELKLTFMGYYICEFLDYFMPDNQENPKIFDLTAKTFDYINQHPEQSHILFTAYKIKAMALQGYTPQLNYCVRCGKNEKPIKFIFNIQEGGLICHKCLPPTNKTFLEKKDIFLLLFLLKSTYEDILKVDISVYDIKGIENIIWKFIQFHLDGRTFKSEELLKKLT